MHGTREESDAYVFIRCAVPADLEGELPQLLSRWPVLGSEIDTDSHGRVRATVYLLESDRSSVQEMRTALANRGAFEIEEGSLQSDDWLAKYREQVKPFSVGKQWWIDPHPARPAEIPLSRIRLVIEPRMAFGTGTHESTQAILLALEELEVSNLRVLDLGTGSGILALAAERLGAGLVVGLDIDEVAIRVAAETARQQDWQSRVRFILGSVGCIGAGCFDIVLCNMIVTNLLPLVADLKSTIAAGGLLVCSGMLACEIDEVTESLDAAGFRVISNRPYGEWASVTASRTGTA